MSIKQINTLIFNTELTNDELTSIIDAVKFKRAQLAKTIKYAIKPGTLVKFRGRDQVTVPGKVRKVAVKFATVDCGFATYRVPLSMLEVDTQPY